MAKIIIFLSSIATLTCHKGVAIFIAFCVKKSIKTSFLYIGTIIGAGFSSGREIALFFGNSSPLNVALSAVFMSMLCAIFLIAGKKRLIPKSKLLSFIIFICASVSLTAMIAGGDYIMHSMSGLPIALGLIMTILAGVVVCLGIEKIKIANSILVPLMVLCIVLIFSRISTTNIDTIFNLSKPLLYSGLDVLIGGVIISKEGEELSYKQIFISCIITCIFMGGMLYMLQSIVLCDTKGSLMPVLEISNKFNLKAICGVLIAGAIFTTLVSSLKIVSDYVYSIILSSKHFGNIKEKGTHSICVFLCLVVSYPISFTGFDEIVDNAYPIISICGVAFTLILLIRLIICMIKSIKNYTSTNRRKRLKNCT